MKIKNKVSTIEINPDLVLGYTCICDPFKSNSYTIVITMDNGRQENVTFFDMDAFQACLNELNSEVREVRKYKKIVNGQALIDYPTRTRIKSVGHMQ